MKHLTIKTLAAFLLFSATEATAAFSDNLNLYTKVGVDLSSRFETLDPSAYHFSTAHKRNTFSPSAFLELTYNVLPQTEFGVGTGFIKRNGFKHNSHGKYNATGYVDDLKESYKLYRYNSVPIYALLKQNFKLGDNTKFYIKGDFGWSYNRTKDTVLHLDILQSRRLEKTPMKMSVNNGHYYGVGIGVEHHNFLVEIGYWHTSARMRYASTDKYKTILPKEVSYNNDAVRLSIGYRF